jgi:hypothetical protein
MVTKLFNIIMIGCLLAVIFLVTAFFFIGSQETFQRLLLDLPTNFLKRMTFGVVIGLLGSVVITLGNLILGRNQISNRKRRLVRIALLTLLLSIIASILGTTIFFYD